MPGLGVTELLVETADISESADLATIQAEISLLSHSLGRVEMALGSSQRLMPCQSSAAKDDWWRKEGQQCTFVGRRYGPLHNSLCTYEGSGRRTVDTTHDIEWREKPRSCAFTRKKATTALVDPSSCDRLINISSHRTAYICRPLPPPPILGKIRDAERSTCLVVKQDKRYPRAPGSCQNQRQIVCTSNGWVRLLTDPGYVVLRWFGEGKQTARASISRMGHDGNDRSSAEPTEHSVNIQSGSRKASKKALRLGSRQRTDTACSEPVKGLTWVRCSVVGKRDVREVRQMRQGREGPMSSESANDS
ncbi:hypothetical protein F5148DRAFT_1310027 [Russula earlei]|uniref:Uncharacterized protein n=1 Tax=Russula earlei TaxID=71964 RepID=A0ACC0U6L2_9AGAM|nr:hypothetical protein F5148DRAFT_1310027 [Russula earlei]